MTDAVRRRFLDAAVVPAPPPWHQVACAAVGGLVGVGFAPDPASGRELLMAVSHNGHGLFDPADGELLARDEDPASLYPDDEELTCPGPGLLAGRAVRIAGLYGGGLHTTAPDGWSVDIVAPDWPSERVLLSYRASPYTAAEQQGWWHIHHNTVSELRATGFSPSGAFLVIATTSDVTIWAR
ncbi:hypothetical protein GCM10010435_50040 [Winogradskya consettensis]|uniref:Uncharacterized protein n=1 Tax=Winogradskya consettensis TaxID=113560 RepID=A0A919SZ74_9ACTN|nr:hypothetical protein [Actinoplanes consettensis]GIM80106.1 hypothetical protein Aco04nite_68950 [Actinoplanes consettensis]